MKNKRISFETMAVNIAKAVAERSEDPFKKVGCAIFNKDARLLSVGYNGIQSKQKISDNFWLDRDKRRSKIIHAEINALSCINMYDKPELLATTLLPCSSCAINIASYKIKKVLYIEDYCRDDHATDIFKFYKIKLIKYNK